MGERCDHLAQQSTDAEGRIDQAPRHPGAQGQAGGHQAGQQRGRRPELGVVHGVLCEPLHRLHHVEETHGVGIAHGAAAPRLEAIARQVDRIDVGGSLRDPLVEDVRALVDEPQQATLHDLLGRGLRIARDAELVGEAERRDAVDDAEIDRLCPAADFGRHVLDRHAEHFRRRHGVDVEAVEEGLLELGDVCDMGQNAQFNLRIIGDDQFPCFAVLRARNKRGPYLAPELLAKVAKRSLGIHAPDHFTTAGAIEEGT